MKFEYFLLIFAWILYITSDGGILPGIFLFVAGGWTLVDAIKEIRGLRHGK